MHIEVVVHADDHLTRPRAPEHSLHVVLHPIAEEVGCMPAARVRAVDTYRGPAVGIRVQVEGGSGRVKYFELGDVCGAKADP